MSKWIKTSNYGDYRDSAQNHKDCYGNRRQESLIKGVRNKNPRAGKHTGSKRISTLRALELIKKKLYL